MGEPRIMREIAAREERARKVRKRAVAALKDSDLSDVLGLMGSGCDDRATSAALKAVLAERMTEYAMRAMEEAKKRKVKLGAATVIIAASESI